jgi:Chromo (CHRromatin Organisation MOdifier) domain
MQDCPEHTKIKLQGGLTAKPPLKLELHKPTSTLDCMRTLLAQTQIDPKILDKLKELKPDQPSFDLNLRKKDNDRPDGILKELDDIEQILAVKLVQGGKLKYRIKWKGWDDDPDWYNASTLSNSATLLREFHDLNTDLPGPPANLSYWLECALNDEFPESRPDDDKPT